jgi:lipoprotein-releasing system ATP-binding protein
MSDSRFIIELIKVSKRYDKAGGQEPDIQVLTEITFRQSPGESVAIVGPSGSGKSTLLNIIGALDNPSSGQVILNGRDLTALDDSELSDVRNKEIGFVFQDHHLLPQCTVIENVLIPTLAGKNHSGGQDNEERARALLCRVGLESREFHRPGQLSGGEKQRAAFVRALINRPKLILADEPTGALDNKTTDVLSQLLVDLNKKEDLTLIVVTHALSIANRMDRVLELNEGMLALQRG